MKNTFILALLLISSFSFSQKDNDSTQLVSTTVEEYNYLTKGYKVQIESGLDVKKGYRFGETISLVKDTYSFDFKPLIRENTNEVAAILLTYQVKGMFKSTWYLCIPFRNPELTELFNKDVANRMDAAGLRYYVQLTAPFVANSFSKLP